MVVHYYCYLQLDERPIPTTLLQFSCILPIPTAAENTVDKIWGYSCHISSTAKCHGKLGGSACEKHLMNLEGNKKSSD